MVPLDHRTFNRPERNNTNETPGCRLLREEREHEQKRARRSGRRREHERNLVPFVGYRDSREHTTSHRECEVPRWVLRSSEEVFEWLRTHNARGDACRPRRAKPLFTSKATRVAQDFLPRVRHVDRNASAAANLDRLSPRSPLCPVVLRASGLIRHVDRHLQTAATSRVPLFDRRHAW